MCKANCYFCDHVRVDSQDDDLYPYVFCDIGHWEGGPVPTGEDGEDVDCDDFNHR